MTVLRIGYGAVPRSSHRKFRKGAISNIWKATQSRIRQHHAERKYLKEGEGPAFPLTSHLCLWDIPVHW